MKSAIAIAALVGLISAGSVTAVNASPVRSNVTQAVRTTPEIAFVPPKNADSHAIPAVNAPATAWGPTTTVRASKTDKSTGAAPNAAPVGTTVGAPGLGSLPSYAFEKTPLSLDTVAQVNLGNGNLLLTSNDGVLNGPGEAIRNDRFYNGLSSANGSFGGGWSSSLSQVDVGITVSGTSPTVHGSNGFSATFTLSGSTYTPPLGFQATLVKNSASTNAYWVLSYNSSGEQLQFSTSGYLTADVDRNGIGSNYAYNSYGQVATVTNPSGRQDTVTWYSGTSNLINQVQDSSGRNTVYTRNSSGQLTRVDKQRGSYEIYSYDSVGRISQALFTGTGSGDMEVDFTYDSFSRVASTKQSLASAPTVVLQSSSYSYASGTTTVTDGRAHASTYAIDAQGHVTQTTNQIGDITQTGYSPTTGNVATTTDGLGGSTPGNITTYSYDALNNATGVNYPTGAAASATYALGTACPGAGSGNPSLPKCSKDDAGNGKQYDYDTAGNLTKTTDTTSGGTGVVTTQKTYDNAARSICGGFQGQVCSVKDGRGNVTTYAYDTHGNLTTVTPPAPLGATTYSYDTLGRVNYVRDGNNKVTQYSYDGQDNIYSTNFDGQPTRSNYWYPNGLEQTTQGFGHEDLYYDGAGRLTKQTGPTDGLTIQYTYDGNGNILSYQDGTGITNYSYDNANQLTQMIEPSGTCTPGTAAPAANSGCVKFTWQYGNEIKRTFPGGANVVTGYDASGRATRITAKNASGTIASDVGYSYAIAGGSGTSADRVAIQSRTSYLEQGTTTGAITAYTYDSLHRLKTAIQKSGATVQASWSYSYDPSGNRTQQITSGTTGIAPGTTNSTYNAANELTAATGDTSTWTYDSTGAMTQNGATGTTQAVDTRGAVVGYGAETFTTFSQGNTEQLTRSIGSSTTSYTSSSLGLATETTGSASTAFDRTGSGDVIASRTGTARDYFVKDALGSVTGIFDATGAYLGGYSYSPYGEALAVGTNTSVTSNTVRYISGYRDSTTGLYKLGARYYDTTIGRFTQFDPSGQEANPYAYAGCNPINVSDPTGLSACTDYFNGVAGFFGATAAVLAVLAIGTSETIVGGLGFGGLALVAGGIGGGLFFSGLATCSIVDN